MVNEVTSLNRLENIENLVEHLANKVETLIDEREEMLAEITRLRNRLLERDKEAVKAVHDMHSGLESIKTDVMRFEQERLRVETRLQGLNDRLIALVRNQRGG